MLKLQPTENTLSLFVRPFPSTGSTDLTIKNEDTNQSTTYSNVTATYDVNKVSIDASSVSFEENGNYRITVTKDGNLICEYKAFCTSEDTYKLTEGQYTEVDSSSDQYIIVE